MSIHIFVQLNGDLTVAAAAGGHAVTVITSAGGQAITLATDGAGKLTSFAGSQYSIATADAASIATGGSGTAGASGYVCIQLPARICVLIQ